MPTYTATVDAFVEQDRASNNNGQAAKIQLRGTGSSLERRGYIFVARPFPLGATVLSATLKVFLAGAWTGSQTITVKRVTESWRESQITWNNKPAVSATNSASVVVSSGSDQDEADIDIAAMLGDVSDGDPWFGVELTLSVNSQRGLYSEEYPVDDLRPVLEVEWAVAPETPTNLKPSSGRINSPTKPVLNWQFAGRDHDAPAEQTYSQVQVATADDFTSPAYDSGYVANTKSQWDLSTATSPTFTALTDGQTRYWRVRVKNDAGIASDWSDTASWTRQSNGTLALVNPAVAPNNYVEERTPPISWTFSGRTQESWRAELFHIRDPASYSDKIVADTPALYWRLADLTGTTATDTSGNSRTGTYAGGFTLGARGALVGSTNEAVDLDGTNGRVNSTYNPFSNGTSRTFEGWANRDTSASIDTLLGGDVATVQPVLRIAAGSGDVVFFADQSGAGVTWTAAWPGTAQWVHWVLTFNESTDTAELYINGVSQGAKTQTVAYNAAPGNFMVGARGSGINDPFDGKLDEVAVYTRALTAGEILSHFTAATAPTGEVVSKYVWPKDKSTDTSFNIPDDLSPETKSKIGLQKGEAYIIQLRVWDTLDRQPITGAPDYVEVSRTFAYKRAGTPAVVTSLTATASDAAATLTWVRSTQPDYFQLVVDGKEVGGYIDPTEVFVSGTTYSMNWWRLNPKKSYTVEVEAVVITSGVKKHSAANATATVTTSPTGIWLIDEDDATAVRIAGGDTPDFGIATTATTYNPIGQRVPVRITDSIGGYTGSFSGVLRGKSDRDEFLDLVGRLVPLRLVLQDLNFPCLLEEVSAPPTPNPGATSNDLLYECSAGFAQIGEFSFDLVGS